MTTCANGNHPAATVTELLGYGVSVCVTCKEAILRLGTLKVRRLADGRVRFYRGRGLHTANPGRE